MNPVNVTITLLNDETFVGLMATVMKPEEVGAVLTLETETKYVIATSVPEAVVSRVADAVIVAAATVVDAACTLLGFMMFVHEKDAAVPAVSPPAVKVTVNTPDVRAAVAAGVPVMPVKSATTMVADDVNPVSVTTTVENPVTDVGVKLKVAF